MIQEKRSIADALVDGRYRLDRLVFKTKSAGCHEATHRNGSTAWLKMPLSPANGAGIALEATFVNATPSALALRDDGTDERGLPYLVFDPIAGYELLADVTARARAGKRDNVERILAVGNALITAVAGVAAADHAVTSIELDEVIVLPSGDVALLGLDRIVKLDDATKAAGVAELSRVLRLVVVECMDVSPGTQGAKIFDAASASHADVAALHAAWRGTATAPLPEVRRRAQSVAELPPAPPSSSAPLTPLAVEIPSANVEIIDAAGEGSMLAYLRSAEAPPSLPAPSTKSDKNEMYDPLAKVPELPRLVQASMRRSEAEVAAAAAPTKRWIAVGAGVAFAAAAFAVGIGIALGDGAPAPTATAASSRVPPAAAAPEVPAIAPTVTVELPDTPEPAAAAPAKEPAAAPAAPSEGTPTAVAPTTGKLRTENAPPGRKIYVDGELVGEAPIAVDLPCGPHTIRAGMKPEARPFHIVCGSERVVRFSPTGNWTVK